MIPKRQIPSEISAAQWAAALAKTKAEELARAAFRKPGEAPVVSTVEMHILEEILRKHPESPH
jgi:hypothetical protein